MGLHELDGPCDHHIPQSEAMMNLLDTNTALGTDVDGLYQEHTQVLPDHFMDTIKSERHAKFTVRAGEHDRVASVPAFVAELWMRPGYDFYRMSAREIVAKLNAGDLGAFVATPRRV